MRFVRGVFSCLVLLWFATGCLSRPASLAHVMRIAVANEPRSLSPLVAFSQIDLGDDLLFAQTLVGLDADGRLTPELVTRVPSLQNGDISSDGRRITYHLRHDIRFADGSALTSGDVAFTYRAILDPRNAAAGERPYRAQIARLETPGPFTVRIVLRARWNAAVSELFAQSDFAIGILPAHAFDSTKVVGTAWDDHAFGSGPFRVTEWRRGDRLVLEPNPYFRPAPKLHRIEIRFVPNYESALLALRTHEVDVAHLQPDEAKQARSVPGIRVARDEVNGYEGLYLQTARGPTSDLGVRRAIADGLDYRALASVSGDFFKPASSFFGPTVATWRRGPLEPPFVRDTARAARELDAAGWRLHDGVREKDGTPMNLLFIANASSQTIRRLTVVVQNNLASLGVPVTIKTMTESMMDAADGPERNGRFALSYGGLIGGADPEPSVTFSCADARPGGANYSRFCSLELDALFADQGTAATGARRRNDFARIERIVRDELPVIPLHQYAVLWGISNRVSSSYRRNPLDFPLDAERWDTR